MFSTPPSKVGARGPSLKKNKNKEIGLMKIKIDHNRP